MKNVVKTISFALTLILLFSVGLIAGTYAMAAAPTAEKDYEVDRITDADLFENNEPDPEKQSEPEKETDPDEISGIEYEFNQKYQRCVGLIKEIMPEYDTSLATPVYPLKSYQDGLGDGKGLSLKEVVEKFGVPYEGPTSGMFTLCYYTEDGYTVLMYIGGDESVSPVNYYIEAILYEIMLPNG